MHEKLLASFDPDLSPTKIDAKDRRFGEGLAVDRRLVNLSERSKVATTGAVLCLAYYAHGFIFEQGKSWEQCCMDISSSTIQ